MFKMYSKEYYQKNKERIRKCQKKYTDKIRAIEHERTEVFNSLSNEEQIIEMLRFVNDERAKDELNDKFTKFKYSNNSIVCEVENGERKEISND